MGQPRSGNAMEISSETAAVRANLQQVVAELCAEGDLDSGGYFTVDSSKALDKMRRFQVQQPKEYILWLAAAALQCQSSTFCVTRGVDAVCVEFESHAPPPGGLQSLLEDGAQERPGPIGHLAFALTAALCAQPDEVVIEWGSERLRLKEGYSRLSQRDGSPTPRVRVIFIGSKSAWMALESSELDLLHRRVLPQMRMEVNVKGCSGYQLHPDLLHGLHCWQGTHPGNPLEPVLRGKGYIHQSHSSPFSVVMTLDTWHRNAPGEVSFLYEGLLFPVQVPCPFAFRAVVYGAELRLDLSRTQIVKSPAYDEALQLLQSLSISLSERFLKHYRPAYSHLAQPWLETMREHWTLVGDTERAELCSSWLTLGHRTGASGDYKDPPKLVDQLLQQFPEPANIESRQSLRASMARKKRWRDLLQSLLKLFGFESSFRVDFALDSPDPECFVLEGVASDGTQVVISAEANEVTIDLHLPLSGSTALSVPPGWEVLKNLPHQVLFRSSTRSWKEPSQLLALVECVLETHRQPQSLYQPVLPCPGCAQPMEKVLFDVVSDRCTVCGHVVGRYRVRSAPPG